MSDRQGIAAATVALALGCVIGVGIATPRVVPAVTAVTGTTSASHVTTTQPGTGVTPITPHAASPDALTWLGRNALGDTTTATVRPPMSGELHILIGYRAGMEFLGDDVPHVFIGSRAGNGYRGDEPGCPLLVVRAADGTELLSLARDGTAVIAKPDVIREYWTAERLAWFSGEKKE